VSVRRSKRLGAAASHNSDYTYDRRWGLRIDRGLSRIIRRREQRAVAREVHEETEQ
jgi:hypothetical protein